MRQGTGPNGYKPHLIGRDLLQSAYRLNVPAEHRSPSRRCADLRSVGWKVDIERAVAPHQLKERPVHSARKLERDASSVRAAHFLSIDGRTLCLFGVGVP